MENYGVGERWLYFQEKGKKWIKCFTCIRFETNTLSFYLDELKKQYNVHNCEFYDAVKSKNQPCCIRVVNCPQDGSKKKSFYVYGEELRSIDEFKVELEECDGTFEGIDVIEKVPFICSSNIFLGKSVTRAIRLETVEVHNWTKKDVLLWLREIKMADLCEKAFKNNDIDGLILMELDEQTLVNIGVKPKYIKPLVTEIHRLKENKTFSKQRFVVKSKFEKFPGYKSESNEFQSMIDSLCNPALLKHRFLSTADLKSHTLKEYTREDYEESGLKQPDTLQQYNEAKIKIKIVVTEILHTSRSKALRKIASPVVSALIPQFQQEFGFFHTAIIVGPWYLEWTDSELVIPKRMVSGRAIISADVDTLNVPKAGLQEISDLLAECVVKWNTLYKYRNTKGVNECEGNCQDFVDDVLRTLGVSTNFHGALGNFIQSMRGKGSCILSFSPSPEFKEHFGITEKSWVFKTHLELDTFCVGIRKKCLDIYNIFSSEWSLLKSFDRAFWLRHLKNPENEQYKPMPPTKQSLKPFNTGCPFNDPRETLSYK